MGQRARVGGHAAPVFRPRGQGGKVKLSVTLSGQQPSEACRLGPGAERAGVEGQAKKVGLPRSPLQGTQILSGRDRPSRPAQPRIGL